MKKTLKDSDIIRNTCPVHIQEGHKLDKDSGVSHRRVVTQYSI